MKLIQTERIYELADGTNVVVGLNDQGMPATVTAGGGPRDGDWIKEMPPEVIMRIAALLVLVRDEARSKAHIFASEDVCIDHGIHEGHACPKCKKSTPAITKKTADEGLDALMVPSAEIPF